MFNIARWVRIIRSQMSRGYTRVDLEVVLSGATPDAPPHQKIAWFDDLLEWIRLPVTPEAKNKYDYIQSSRIKFLLDFLDRFPDFKTKVSQTLQSILLESESVYLFSESGIETQQAFLRELNDRMAEMILPSYQEPLNLKHSFEKLFNTQNDVEWLKNLDEVTLIRLSTLILPTDIARNEFNTKSSRSILLALRILIIRGVNLTLDREFRSRLPQNSIANSPFFTLLNIINNCLAHNSITAEDSKRILVELAQCHLHIDSVYSQLENSGVSIDLVYKLDSAKSLLKRLRHLVNLHQHLQKSEFDIGPIVSFVVTLAELNQDRSSLIAFFGANVNLISRKIVERTSETGEHYITRNRFEYFDMLLSAIGGGAVTVFTTFFKSAIGKMNFPLFFDGFFTGLNYSLSFIFIQLSHFTLATKTPAMTASTLAAKLKNINTEQDANEFVEDVVCMIRSAFISVVGNVGVVIPGCILFDLIFYKIIGRHVFTNQYSIEQFTAHHPFTSLTLLYAIITGFILWLSSILGGWFENWVVYNRQIEIFEESNYFKRLLTRFLQMRIAHFLRKSISGLATNISLGFMLSYAGVVGKFFGLPLQVRHVTLSAGTLSFSIMGTDSLSANSHLIIGSWMGVLCIGLLNFTTSFSLSLFVAARARDIQLSQFPFLFKLIGKRFLTNPRDFFLPEK